MVMQSDLLFFLFILNALLRIKLLSQYSHTFFSKSCLLAVHKHISGRKAIDMSLKTLI